MKLCLPCAFNERTTLATKMFYGTGTRKDGTRDLKALQFPACDDCWMAIKVGNERLRQKEQLDILYRIP